MAKATVVRSENPPSYTVNDKIVRRRDDFPDLGEALRDGDLLTARMICAQLFPVPERPEVSQSRMDWKRLMLFH